MTAAIRGRHLFIRAVWLTLLPTLALVGCGGSTNEASQPPAVRGAAPSGPDYPPPPPLGAPAPEYPRAEATKLLKVTPDRGFVGAPFTISGEGLPAARPVQIVWVTWDGVYLSEVTAENVQYVQPKFMEKRVFLTPTSGTVATDAAGAFTASFAAPDDYGEAHELYAVIDGVELARGGFSITRSAKISPAEGPIGTPITISIQGLGRGGWERTVGILYDNKYVGFGTALATRGSVAFEVRAAGPVGARVIEVRNGAVQPYLNLAQAPTAYIATYQFTFNVTRDAGPPANTLDWPGEGAVTRLDVDTIRTTSSGVAPAPGLLAALQPGSGPVLSMTVLRATGLPVGADTEVFFATARGNRNPSTGSRWIMEDIPVGKAKTTGQGSLSLDLQVPDDLGGWHMVRIITAEKVVGEIPFYVEQSLVSVTPQSLKAGETFTITMKGVGWTELDNGLAVTYDNAVVGYACGFNSQGDVTFDLIATGGVGTHLIDIYPMVYNGKDPAVFPYRLPWLSALQDFPALSLGYRLPVYRLAIEVIE